MSKRGIVAGSRATGAKTAPNNQPNTYGANEGISPLLAQYQQWTIGSGGTPYDPLPRKAAEFLLGQFGPLSPQQPMPIDQPQGDLHRPEPRRWQYPVGWNMPHSPPGTEGLKLTDFPTLRTYADLYSVARSCIQVRKNEIRGIEWDIIPTKEAEKKMRGDHKAHQDFGERREKVLKFFKRPDPDYRNFSSWIDALLEDHFVVDAMSLYVHPSRIKGKGVLGTDLAALDIIDGTTIRPLINLQGGKPAVPSPSYQQYLQGIPRVDLLSMITGDDVKELDHPEREYRGDQLLYLPYTARSWTPYGFPATERTIVPILTGLRKQQFQLDYFDEGTLPGAFVSPGENSGWTPNQIKEMQDGLNAIAGDPAWKHKIVALPPGSKVDPQRPGPLADQFDEIVMSMVCMGFDVQPMELGITPRVSTTQTSGAANQMAKASQDTQERKATKPLLWWLKTSIFDEIIQNTLHQEDMQFIFEGLEEGEDEGTKTTVIKDQISTALMSIDEGRAELGKSPWGLPETSDPGIMTASGFTPLGQFNPMTEQPGPQPGEPDPNAPPPGQAPPPGSPPGTPPSPPPIQTIGPGNKPPAPPIPPGAAGEAAAKPDAKRPAATKSADDGGVSLLKPTLAELDMLARHLNKGRALDTWQCQFITPNHLDLISKMLELGKQPSEAVATLSTHVEKTWNVQYDESKHPRGAGGRFGATNTGIYAGSHNGAIAVSYSGKAPPKGPAAKKPKKPKKGKKGKKTGAGAASKKKPVKPKAPPKTPAQRQQSRMAKQPPPHANDPVAWEMYDQWYNQQSAMGKSGVPHTADTPSDEAIAERGRDYWRTHVPWGSPGDFNTCVEGVMQHAGMTHDQAAGYCNLRHHEATGEWPAQHAAQMRGKMLDPGLIKVGPKGYEHGWIFVGAPGAGGVVHHPKHGKGEFLGVKDGKAHVKWGNGETHSFEVGKHPSGKAGGGSGPKEHFAKRQVYVGSHETGTAVHHPGHGRGKVTGHSGGQTHVKFDSGHQQSFDHRHSHAMRSDHKGSLASNGDVHVTVHGEKVKVGTTYDSGDGSRWPIKVKDSSLQHASKMHFENKDKAAEGLAKEYNRQHGIQFVDHQGDGKPLTEEEAYGIVPDLYNAPMFGSAPKHHPEQLRMNPDPGGKMKAAMEKYGNKGYEQQNIDLRAGKKTGAKWMDENFNQAKPLQESIQTYRGVDNAASLFGEPGSMVGKTFSDKAYLSTSTSKEVADTFTKDVAKAENAPGMLTIHIPKGAKAVKVNTGGTNIAEREALLPRNSKLRITSDVLADGVRRIGAEVVLDA